MDTAEGNTPPLGIHAYMINMLGTYTHKIYTHIHTAYMVMITTLTAQDRHKDHAYIHTEYTYIRTYIQRRL